MRGVNAVLENHSCTINDKSYDIDFSTVSYFEFLLQLRDYV
jgi:hypothetical protein